jgi:hypothetical protein
MQCRNGRGENQGKIVHPVVRTHEQQMTKGKANLPYRSISTGRPW